MNIILYDQPFRQNLLPLTFTRPVSEIRVGILTIREKWEMFFNKKISTYTVPYLSRKYKTNFEADNIFINSTVLPNAHLVNEINCLKSGEAIINATSIIACRSNSTNFTPEDIFSADAYSCKPCSLSVNSIVRPWHIFMENGEQIEADYKLITEGRTSQPINPANHLICSEKIFIEEGAQLHFCTLNASTGSIYIGKNAEVMEGSVIRGPFALCESSVVKLSTKIYGPTTIGPHSKVGGEINNSVIFGYSNKAHDGFLGNSVIGEWCNLGAGTNNSNLKNNYSEVKVWNYTQEKFVGTSLQFCGLLMGDHSKCGINTMFNTGTVVGVSANIFGSGFPRNFIPSFAWGGSGGTTTYAFAKAMEVAHIVMERRGIKLDEDESDILRNIFSLTEKYRSAFK